MGRRSHVERNKIKREMKNNVSMVRTSIQLPVVEKSVCASGPDSATNKLTYSQEKAAEKGATQSDIVIEKVRDTFTSATVTPFELLRNSVETPNVGQLPSADARESVHPLPTVNRTTLKREQRENIVYVKCAYSTRNISALTSDDLTAHDPMLNVVHILHHNCVPVPVHWRLRNGCFLSEHVPKYTVASKQQNICRTPLFATSVYDPKDVWASFQRSNHDIKKIKSSQEVSISYEDRDSWVTIPLLAQGDIYQEAKQGIICRSGYSSGILSDELRKALNIGPDDPPPWITRQSLLPRPPWLQTVGMDKLIARSFREGPQLIYF